MNDTSNTPDEQHDGRVATDATDAGAPLPRPSGESSGAGTGAGGPSAGNGSSGAGGSGAVPSPGPRADPSPPTPAAGVPSPVRRPDPAPATPPAGGPSPVRRPESAVPTPPSGMPAPGGGNGSPASSGGNGGPAPSGGNGGGPASSGNGGSPSARPGPAPRLVKDDAPTTTLRAPFNGAAVPLDDDTTTPVTRGRPAVPGPGPDAAGPPPWHRVPGQEPTGPEPSAPAQRREPSMPSDLLDDGPTAFLEAPSRSDEERSDEPRKSGWASRGSRGRPPRQAALQLRRLDPWSVLKLSLVLAVVLFLVWMVAIGVLYGVLDGIGVWDRLNGTYADLVSGSSAGGSPLISAGRVFGLAAVVGAINSLLFAVAVTVGAFIYNVSADLVGGIEVTLSERD